MFLKLKSLFIFIILSFSVLAQKNITISGNIKDKKTGESLIGATIKNAANPALGTATNEYGFYSLTLPNGNYKLLIDYIGYKQFEKEITLEKKTTLDIALDPAETELKEVTISGKTSNIKSAQMGVEKLNIKDINLLPVIFGEKDIMKTVQLLPGVQPSGEGSSGFYVRGGAADQNLILLDEAVVYNPSHLLGFFSTFNSDALKDVTMYKGTAPAQFGGRLSSVLDVKMNDGNNQEYHVSGGIGLISSKINIEGPIKKDESSFLITARRTYADVFLKLSKDSTINKSSLYFYDINAKLNYKIAKNDRLFLSGYFGQDDLGLGTLFGLSWGNATGTLRWNHLINDKVFSNTSLIYSDYAYGISISNSGISANINSIIKDWNLKEELEFFSNPNHSIRTGISSIYHTIVPSNITGSGIVSSSQPNKITWENGIYLSDNWKVNTKLNVDLGIRLSTFSVLGGSNFYNLNADGSIKDTLHYKSDQIVTTYTNPEPRISASYLLNESSSLKAGYSRNAQYMHLISNSNSSNPTDKWVSTNNLIKPEVADLVSLGYFKNLKDNKYEFSIEGYYKNMINIVDYRDNANVLTNAAIEPQLLYGQGRAYGAEFLLRKKEGKFTGWIAYTLSRSETQINGINSNNWYPSRQDRTHDLSVVGIYKLNKKWVLSSDFVFYTGNAVTFPSGKYEIQNQVYFLYTSRNAYRMPNYNRLDFSATKQLKPHKKYTSELVFSLYNVYGYENAYLIRFQTDPNNANETQAVQIALFRWVPSISYNFKF